jgi:hypothetical protein
MPKYGQGLESTSRRTLHFHHAAHEGSRSLSQFRPQPSHDPPLAVAARKANKILPQHAHELASLDCACQFKTSSLMTCLDLPTAKAGMVTEWDGKAHGNTRLPWLAIQRYTEKKIRRATSLP